MHYLNFPVSYIEYMCNLSCNKNTNIKYLASIGLTCISLLFWPGLLACNLGGQDNKGNQNSDDRSAPTSNTAGNEDDGTRSNPSGSTTGNTAPENTEKSKEKTLDEKIKDVPADPVVNRDTFYVTKKAEGFYFVLERIETEKDFKQWENYLHYTNELRKEITTPLRKAHGLNARYYTTTFLEKMALATSAVEMDASRVLKAYRSAEVWVAYVSNVLPKTKFAIGNRSNIEMSVTVISNPKAPFQIHMGILRGLFYLRAKNLAHRNSSVDLHSFIAKAMRTREPNDKKFVITNPLKSMADIFVNKLDNTYYRFYSFGRGGDTIYEMGNPAGSHEWIQKTGNNSKDADFSIKIFDRKNREIFHLAKNNNIKKNDYNWFFSELDFSNQTLYFIAELKYLENNFPHAITDFLALP